MMSFATSSFFSGQTLLKDAPKFPSSVKFRQPSISASCASTVEMPRIQIGRSNPSLYEILGVQTGATCQEIKTAYRRLARTVHPDVTSSNGQSSSDEFMKVHEAYATLSDPQKRADYDRRLIFRRPVPMSSSFSMSSSGRRWETDQCW